MDSKQGEKEVIQEFGSEYAVKTGAGYESLRNSVTGVSQDRGFVPSSFHLWLLLNPIVWECYVLFIDKMVFGVTEEYHERPESA